MHLPALLLGLGEAPIDDLARDQEIGAWANQQRWTLSQAGFSNKEIDDYIGGAPTADAVSGLYPRGSMPSDEATICGLLVPFPLLVAAGYLALGASRAGWRSSGAAPVGIVVDGLPPLVASPRSPLPRPAWTAGAGRADASEFLFRVAILATVINPVFFVLDVPSMMLLIRLRFPRWLFALLVLRAFTSAPGARH